MTETFALAWNEGEEPETIAIPDSILLNVDIAIYNHMETKTHGKLVAKREDRDLEIYYRAYTDEHRGRIVVSGLTAEEADEHIVRRRKQLERKCFTPRELYALKPTRTEFDLYSLVMVHLTAEIDGWAFDMNAASKTERVEIRNLVDYCADGRRTWTLQTIWFDGEPVMVVTSSGRDGDENHERFITNRERFDEMLDFFRSFGKEVALSGHVSIDQVIPSMTEFYNATIHDYYNVDTQTSNV